MSDAGDPKDPKQSEQPQGGESGSSSAQYDLFEELRKFGQQMETATRSAWENERTRSFQRDVSAGMQEFFGQMQRFAQTFQENPHVQNLTERGQKAIHEAQENQVTRDFQQTMARSVAYMNTQMEDFLKRMQAQTDATSQPQESSSAQQVPIDDESQSSASTGATERLDPNEDEKKQ
jgi:hypothetical protein